MSEPRRAVILITVHRRYHELAENLPRLRQLFGAFAVQPAVIVVAAQPEPAARAFFAGLLAHGQADHILWRPTLGTEPVGATTHAESVNLEMGLRLARDLYGEHCYAIGQAADVLPTLAAYRRIATHMEAGGDGVVFHWSNGSARDHVWHTNFFAVSLARHDLWPPVVPAGHPDVLERAWGMRMQRPIEAGVTLHARPCGEGLHRWHNSSDNSFVHRHVSEGLPPYPLPTNPEPLPRPLTRWEQLLTWLGWRKPRFSRPVG